MAMWLEDGYDEGDQIDEMAKMTSTRASRSIRAEEEVVTTITAAPTVLTVDDEDDDACTVFEVGSVRDSVVHTTSSTEQTATGQRIKRKARSGKELESDSQDAGIELGNKRKDSRQSASTRTRASAVHNLSERRRRDRINEKMKTLQELIPRCNKSDKASTLDNAIEYLKSLQLQVQECKVRSHRREKHQMMSYMQYNMGQMMFPGAPRYLQPVGFAMGGMPYPIMPVGPMPPYPPNVESSAANLCPQLLPSLHQYPASSSINTISSSMAQVPNFAAPRYAAVLVPYQGQTLAEPGTSKEANNAKRSTDGFKIH